ncbi:hypothetical protein DE4585_03891 [Mycobacteroides salmoniphilum]|uniref:Uncharacterized protein n=1 Tax=Mycobacteroides salmoniphilum TaxID=404941 RepID=A0A4R8S098_9MYCO|nr:hypothetical protein DE4585_03891 [Mycobacteroides salmoniphilum]
MYAPAQSELCCRFGATSTWRRPPARVVECWTGVTRTNLKTGDRSRIHRQNSTGPTSLILLPNAEIGLVTGNGRRTVDIQAADIRAAVTK